MEKCVDCKLCTQACAFLEKYGSPGKICNGFWSAMDGNGASVFECNLCGLCQVVCPKDLDCAAAFLEIRKAVQNNGQASSKVKSILDRHKTICAYEAWGSSPLLSLHLFPEGCRSVFFPGCTLAATRSAVTLATYDYLKKIETTFGIVLDCCAKPSHDIGLKDRFERSFTELSNLLRKQKIKRIYTACPSCYSTFERYAPQIEVYSVYELLAEHYPAGEPAVSETVTLHDACSARHAPNIQDSVRALVRATGADIQEMEHNRAQAICCGEGAAAAFVAPEITGAWKILRKNESAGRRVITYCAGCSNILGREVPNTHVLDLIFDGHNAWEGREKIARSPFTYFHRLLLKHALKRANNKNGHCNSVLGRL